MVWRRWNGSVVDPVGFCAGVDGLPHAGGMQELPLNLLVCPSEISFLAYTQNCEGQFAVVWRSRLAVELVPRRRPLPGRASTFPHDDWVAFECPLIRIGVA